MVLTWSPIPGTLPGLLMGDLHVMVDLHLHPAPISESTVSSNVPRHGKRGTVSVLNYARDEAGAAQ